MQIQKIKYVVKEVMGEIIITEMVEIDVHIQKVDNLKGVVKAVKSVIKKDKPQQ